MIKKNLHVIANILLIIFGLMGIKSPVTVSLVESVNLGALLDTALLQPIFIALLVAAIIGFVMQVRETLSFLPIILEFVIGIATFVFIFPMQNNILSYIGLLGIAFVTIWPYITKQIQKKNVRKIKV